MNANNTPQAKVKEFRFHIHKTNKQDTIYQGLETNPRDSFITDFVKVERFQGYSNAYNLGLYFRIKDASSWAKSKKITGLWKTQNEKVFFGDIKEDNVKTLLLFEIDPETNNLRVFEFEKGFYPSRSIIDKLSNGL